MEAPNENVVVVREWIPAKHFCHRYRDGLFRQLGECEFVSGRLIHFPPHLSGLPQEIARCGPGGAIEISL